MTKIIQCHCKHEFQDGMYGKGNRVHNQMKKKDKKSTLVKGWKCTVCLSIKPF